MFKSTYEDILNDEIQNVATFGWFIEILGKMADSKIRGRH
jgi:hypothetical protein